MYIDFHFQTCETVEHVTNFLKLIDIPAEQLSRFSEWDIRTSTINDFREGKFRVLVTTDLLARGLNVKNVRLIINFNLPYVPPHGKLDRCMYDRRASRATNFGSTDLTLNLVSKDEEYLLPQIRVRLYNVLI